MLKLLMTMGIVWVSINCYVLMLKSDSNSTYSMMGTVKSITCNVCYC